jgi:thiamine-phosphate pyrophosphorylase
MSTPGPEEFTVRLNGESRSLAAGTDVAQLLHDLGLDPTAVVVEVDGEILFAEQHAQAVLRSGAQVEIVHFVGGG